MDLIHRIALSHENDAPPKPRKLKASSHQRADMLTVDEAAAYLGYSVASLRGWRLKGQAGPAHVKLLGRVRYERSALDEFLNASTVHTRGAM